MRIAGIIAEYNPFHNGHLFLLNKIRSELKPDLVIAVISGDFTQRGEPAILSKWERTQIALHAGVDLVIELPYLFAVGRADIFANGAVSTLDQLGITHLAFGSEEGAIQPFLNSIQEIKRHQAIYQETFHQSLSLGISYPNAHAAAYQAVNRISAQPLIDLTKPNNSLGYHYIQAIQKRGSRIEPITFKRKQAGHGDSSFKSSAEIASATSLRTYCLSGKPLEAIRNKMPDFAYSIIKEQKNSGRLVDWETFFPFLKYRLLSSSASDIRQIYEAEEGIENRLYKFIHLSEDFESFIGQIKSKRYTWVRLQRLAVHILTQTRKTEAKIQASAGEAAYLRLLGMNLKGQAYLSQQRKQLQIPLIAKIRRFRPEVLEMDVRAAQIYDYLASQHAGDRLLVSETAHAPIRYNENLGTFAQKA
ncbi:MAG: nucleotidyltransferase [Sporolactobacillus sp.]